jgi:hypothetical protein
MSRENRLLDDSNPESLNTDNLMAIAMPKQGAGPLNILDTKTI